MDESGPSWIVDAYSHLWSRSDDFAAERHGLTVLTCPPPSCFGEHVIAVRDEYLQLWHYLREAHEGKHRGGLVLTGHPSTGKHNFILYAFARALKEHIPVAFCDSPGEYYFCDGTGCRLYPGNYYVEHWHKVETGKFFLALVGYSESVAIPPWNFLDRSQMCFTVQANSPLGALRNRWAEKRDAVYWTMPLWTEDEVRKLQHFYEQEGPHPWKNNDDTYYSPLEAFALLGPSIRKCFCADGNPKTALGPLHDFQAFLRPSDVFDNTDAFLDAIQTKTATATSPLRQGQDTPGLAPSPSLSFHRLFAVSKPHRASNPLPWSAAFHCAIPTLFLSRLLAARFRRRPTDEQVAFIRKLHSATYAQARAFVYEPAILDVLCAPCAPASGPGVPMANINATVTCHLADGSAFALGPGLVLASDRVTVDTPSIVPRDDHLYLLHSNSGLPGLNAFVITGSEGEGEGEGEGQTRVTMLQTTVTRARREVVSSAVSRLMKLVQRSMPNTNTNTSATRTRTIRWSFVFVSPGGRGEQLARTLREVRFRGRHPTVVAGWLEIGGLLGFPERVLDALKCEDAEALGEVIDNDPEPGEELEGLRGWESKTTYLDTGFVMRD